MSAPTVPPSPAGTPAHSHAGSTADSAALSDLQYREKSGALLSLVEKTIDTWLDTDVIDIDSQRSGGLLELHFPNGSKIIINTQPPLHEIWLAAKGGGFHYKWAQGQWQDTRNGSEFLATLSAHASAQAGQALHFSA